MVCDEYGRKKAVPYFRKFLSNYCRLRTDRKQALMKLIEIRDSDKLIEQIKKAYGIS
jgi:hypothetical protein